MILNKSFLLIQSRNLLGLKPCLIEIDSEFSTPEIWSERILPHAKDYVLALDPWPMFR